MEDKDRAAKEDGREEKNTCRLRKVRTEKWRKGGGDIEKGKG